MPTTKPLLSNAELYRYLLQLAKLLAERGQQAMADDVARAAGTAAGLSTEFLGESRIALRHTLAEEKGVLHSHEREYVVSVIEQLDRALVG